MNAEPISTLYSQRPTDGRNFKEPYPSGGMKNVKKIRIVIKVNIFDHQHKCLILFYYVISHKYAYIFILLMINKQQFYTCNNICPKASANLCKIL